MKIRQAKQKHGQLLRRPGFVLLLVVVLATIFGQASAYAALTVPSDAPTLQPNSPVDTKYSKIDKEITDRANSFCKKLYTGSSDAAKTSRSFCRATYVSSVASDCDSKRTSVSNYTKCARSDYSNVEKQLKDKKKTDAQAAASSCANSNCGDPAIECTSGNCDFIGKYVNPAITAFTVTFGIVAVASLIFGGIQYSTSAGDPQKVGLAKRRILNTVVAVVAYFLLFGFLQFLIPGGLFNRG